MVRALCAVAGLLIGLPCSAIAGAMVFCTRWGTGSHMDGCGLAGGFIGLYPGGLAGVLTGWWTGSRVERRRR